MLVQLHSDLHVEFPLVYSKMEEIPVCAPILALVGDIGIHTKETYKNFLYKQADRFETVLVLAGNHEYYNAGHYEQAKQTMKDICAAKPNIVFMDKTSIKLLGIRILGCTLWSFVPPANAKAVQAGLSDYSYITILDSTTKQKRLITVDDTNAWFQDELAWLKQEIALAKQNKETVLVLTHHAPLLEGTSDPKFNGTAKETQYLLQGSPINSAFSSDLQYMLGGNIHTWAFGHTHYSSSQYVKNTHVVSNQLGYLAFSEKAGYKVNQVLDIAPYTEEQLASFNK